MPKGVRNKRYTPEFKKLVVKTMQKERISYRETARQFEISDDKRVAVWEQIYLEEGPKGFAIERRGRSSEGHPRAELEYLKTCKPWFWKTSDVSAKNAGSSETEAKTFPGDPSHNRSTAPCDLLLSSETNE